MSAGPARRAVVRWAWRLFRREWRQQLAVLALLTAAVAAAVAGATLTVNAASHNHGFGRAHAMARIEGLAPDVAAERIAEARQAFGAVDVISHRGVPVPGSVTRLDVRAQRPTGTFSGPLLALRSGRLPTAAGEVALTKGAAELLGAHVGDRVTVGAETRTVVGRVENPSELDDDFALVPRADLGRADSFQLLFDPPSEPGRTGVPDLRIRILGDDGPVAVLVLVAVTLAMALVGLIAAAGFVVVANRRQRQLGMLAAVGAPERQLRLVMVANGALVGTVAAVAGTALGITAWLAAAPSVEHVANHRIGRLDLPWQLVAACGLLAIAMGMAAAWWPGRALSRLPVMAALSGRPTPPRPVHRSVAMAIVLLASGMVAIAVSLPTGERARPWLLIAGLAAVIVGAVFAAPAAIRAVAVPARRLPLAPRLAVRDLARHQSRAAAALAAMTLGLAISVAIVGLAKASEPRGDEGNVSDRQLIIWASDRHTAPDPNLSASQRAALDAHAATVAAALGHPAVLTLDVAMSTAAAADPSIREAITETRQLNPHSFRYVSVPYVATPALLRELHVDPATVSDTVDLLTTHDQPTRLGPDFSQRTRTDFATNVRHVDAPSYSTAPSSLVTEAALRRHGWLRVRTGWLVESPRPLTIEQRAAARAAAASAGLAIETRDSQDALSTIRAIATIAGALLALGIVVMTIGLLRAESSRDLQTLTATGASGRTRRSITASTAAVLSLLGTILGTTGAYAALVAGYHGDLGALLPLPVADLLLLVIGLPVVAAAAGWFLAGPEPQRFAHQALE
jgi:putative ABC transport system permease protein